MVPESSQGREKRGMVSKMSTNSDSLLPLYFHSSSFGVPVHPRLRSMWRRACSRWSPSQSLFDDFISSNLFRYQDSSWAHMLYLKLVQVRGCVRASFFDHDLPISCNLHLDSMTGVHVFLQERRASVIPAHMQDYKGWLCFRVDVLRSPTISDCADLISTPFGLRTVLENGLIPVSHYVLFMDSGCAFLAPVYVDFDIVVKRARQRNKAEVELDDDFGSRYRRVTQSFWAERKDWIALGPAGLSELLLILSGDVELNPGPVGAKSNVKVTRKTLVRSAKRAALVGRSLSKERDFDRGDKDALVEKLLELKQEVQELKKGPPEDCDMPPLEEDRTERDFRVGQEYFGEYRFVVDQGIGVVPCEEPGKWPRVTVVELPVTGGVWLDCVNCVVSTTERLFVSHEELAAVQKAKVWLGPDLTMKKLIISVGEGSKQIH